MFVRDSNCVKVVRSTPAAAANALRLSSVRRTASSSRSRKIPVAACVYPSVEVYTPHLCVNPACGTALRVATSEIVLPQRVEWPTVAVMGSIAAGFAAILRWHDHLPTAVVIGALAVLAAWYNSLQHEVIHGHPTPWRAVNTAMARSRSVWSSRSLVPLEPPRPPPRRAPDRSHTRPRELLRLGRGVGVARSLRPRRADGAEHTARPHARSVHRFSRCGCSAPSGRRCEPPGRDVAAHDHPPRRRRRRARRRGRRGLAVWVYLLGAVWLGWSISLLRSFAEHRFVDGGTQSAVVRAGSGDVVALPQQQPAPDPPRPARCAVVPVAGRAPPLDADAGRGRRCRPVHQLPRRCPAVHRTTVRPSPCTRDG